MSEETQNENETVENETADNEEVVEKDNTEDIEKESEETTEEEPQEVSSNRGVPDNEFMVEVLEAKLVDLQPKYAAAKSKSARNEHELKRACRALEDAKYWMGRLK